MIEFHVEKAPAVSWEDAVKHRIQRGQMVALADTPALLARLHYDAVDDRFALEAEVMALRETRLFDCELRQQHGGMALVFLHPNYGGVPVAVGNGQLKGHRLFTKVNKVGTFIFQVDPNAACFLPLRKPHTANSVQPPAALDGDAKDLSAADLQRLRSEVAIHVRKRY
jgi:hypothetical protein